MQAASAFAHEVGLKGLRIISGMNFCKQKLYTRNCGMVLTTTMTIMVAAQVHLVKLISLLDDGMFKLINFFHWFFFFGLFFKRDFWGCFYEIFLH